MKRSILLFSLILLVTAGLVWPCSVFNYTRDDGKTFVGRNLDWIPSSYGWIELIQPKDGGYGVIIFGAEEHIWPQGGMNDQGLVLGMTAVPFHDIPSDPDKLLMELDFWEKLFTTCADVPEVLAFLDTYDLSSRPGYFEQGQMLWTDKYGNSVVHEGDVVSNREGHYQMITNFCYTRPWLGGYPCGRYDLIDQHLSSSTNLSEERLIDLLELVHGTIWGGYTVWSLFYDPATLDITLFNRGDFTRSLHLNLKEILSRGVTKYYMDDLFSGCVGDWEGDTVEEAEPLSGCGTFETALECGGDVDVYTFRPAILGEYTFETVGTVDTYLEILDPNGTVLQSDHDSGSGGNARIQILLEGNQVYAVRLKGESADVSGAYGLSLSGCTGQRDCGDDPANDDHRFALPVRTCRTIQASFDCPGDIDYYSFRASAPGMYYFVTEGSSDTVVQLEDAQFQVLAYDDDGWLGQNAWVEKELNAGDTVWVRVSEFGDDDVGDYTITIRGCDESEGWTTIIPAAARDAGAGGTDWVSDLLIRNQGDAPASVMVEYWPREGAPPEPAALQVQPGSLELRDNVVENLFGMTKTSGALRLHSDQPILVSSRTYNRLEEGTYGQTIVGQPAEEALLAGELGYLLGLVESEKYRTNLGLMNPSGSESQIKVTVYDSGGVRIGESMTRRIPGYSRLQIDHVLNEFGTSPIEEAWAEVEVEYGEIFSYISIVDMLTGDPVFRPAERALGADRGVPGVARAVGESDTLWRTELWLLSISEFEQMATLRVWPRGPAREETEYPITLQPGSLLHVDDAFLELLELSEGKGTFFLTAGPEVLITGRTYNQEGEGTYGQGLTALRPDQAITGDAAGYLIMAAEDSRYRANLGLVNPGSDPVTVEVRLIDSDGIEAETIRHWTVEGKSSIQIGHVVKEFGVDEAEAAALKIEIANSDPDGRIWAWLSVVDQVTGDAVFENATVEVPLLSLPDQREEDSGSEVNHQPKILGSGFCESPNNNETASLRSQ